MAKLTEHPTGSPTRKSSSSWTSGLFLSALAVVLLALLLVQLDTFETASYPLHEFGEPMRVPAPRRKAASLPGLELIGSGQLLGPEDFVYEPKSGLIYTGCHDGWIKRFALNESVAENWVQTGGRPLGIAIDDSGDVFVADAYKGILKVSKDGKIELLTDEAEGVKLGLADGVVVAKNGMVYFTDGSYKYNYHEALKDVLEGRPHGRFLSYDPSTKQTKVIARDLYFANGVELSPDQDFVIFCETFMMRCFRYYVQGEKEGSIDVFADNLPGFLDNIRYDGEGRYWIGIPWDNSMVWKFVRRFPFMRKILAFMLKHLGTMPDVMKFGGVIALDLEGKAIGGYYDETWRLMSGGVKIGEHLYMGSVATTHIVRLNLTQHPIASPSV